VDRCKQRARRRNNMDREGTTSVGRGALPWRATLFRTSQPLTPSEIMAAESAGFESGTASDRAPCATWHGFDPHRDRPDRLLDGAANPTAGCFPGYGLDAGWFVSVPQRMTRRGFQPQSAAAFDGWIVVNPCWIRTISTAACVMARRRERTRSHVVIVPVFQRRCTACTAVGAFGNASSALFAAVRFFDPPATRAEGIGVRCVRSATAW
jgi:hypothetical protein